MDLLVMGDYLVAGASDRPSVVVPVLALPSVSPRVAELCTEHGWGWFDLAGNRLPGQTLSQEAPMNSQVTSDTPKRLHVMRKLR